MTHLETSSFGTIIGVVVSKPIVKKTKKKKLVAIVRIKINNASYVDIYGFEDIAKIMNLICTIGSVVYIEYQIGNAMLNQVKRKVIHLATKVERLVEGVKPSVKDKAQELEIIDNLDPFEYIQDTFKYRG